MTSVSAIFGCRLLISPQNCSFPSACRSGVVTVAPRPHVTGVEFGGLVIESSSRPQKKATAHHRKSRPKKTQPWDVKRGPAVYPPLPEMPPEWTLVSEGASNAIAAVVVPEGESTQA